jgi:heme/copper-type cytochrome/quinol oxidase subunit 1
MSHFEDMSLQPWFIVAGIGAFLILLGILAFLVQIGVSIRRREAYAVGNDPWDGRTLEWATSSPPPATRPARRRRASRLPTATSAPAPARSSARSSASIAR